jgi:uncharacterized protein with PIN domain
VFERLHLAERVRPFTLCLHCNAPLRPVAREDVLERLPPSVRSEQTAFSTCDVCSRVYWPGSHWKRMNGMLDDAMTGER